MRAILRLAALVGMLSLQVFAETESKRPLGVPEDATHFRGKWYRVYLGNMSWRSAEARCAQLGGRLVVIPDQETQDFLVKLANGREGYVREEFLSLVIAFRAYFEKKNGAWVMTALVAGD